MKKGLVLAGFSGIGKTELGKKYKNVLDLDSAEFVYDDSNMLDIPFEQRKGEVRVPNPNWPNNYIKAIKEAQNKYDIVMVWDREDIIKEYIKNNIDFVLCYPEEKDLENYAKRFFGRGNTDKYVNFKLSQYFDKMKLFENINVKKIILKNNETLEDYLVKQNFKLIEK